MQQHAAALDMAEKAVAQPGAFVRALDQAGDVGEHEFASVDRDDAELRMQRRERIVRDLRLGRAHRGEQSGFARIRQPDQAGVGDQLEAQPERALLARQSRIGVARRAIGRRLEMRVAEAAIAALGQHDALSDLREIGEQRLIVLIENLRSDRHLEDNVGAVRAGAVLAHAVAAGLRLEVLLVAIIDQRIEAFDAFRNDVAAAPAVAAVRSAELDELLAAERDGPCAAIARADIDFGLVEEFHAPDIGAKLSRANRLV